LTPLPAALLGGRGPLVAWRLEPAIFAAGWDSGEGARLYGGRWNSRLRRAVYAAFDPATAILEVAAHKGFEELALAPHVLTSLKIGDPGAVHVVPPDAIPDPAWLTPLIAGKAQQAFGDGLLASQAFVIIPSAVSAHSWNVVFDPERTRGAYALLAQEPFALDPRLKPPR
jgi:RES domain-containing protein